MTARVIALDLDGTLLTPKKPYCHLLLKRSRAPEKQDTNLSLSQVAITLLFILFIRHWRWIHLQFAATAPTCMIIRQKRYWNPIPFR